MLLDPHIPDCINLIEAGKKRGLMITAVVPRSKLVEYYRTADALLEVGMH